MKARKLKIEYVNYPILSIIWCFIFGHSFRDVMWTSGGEELCERCTKYRYKKGYWFLDY